MKIRAGIMVFLVLMTFSACNTDIPPTVYENEGTKADPVFLTVGTTHSGMVAAGGTSYYKFVAAGDGAHTISLTNLPSYLDVDWVLYNDTGYTVFNSQGASGIEGEDETGFTVGLTSGTTYYLAVTEESSAAAAGPFSLKVAFP